MQIFKTVTAGWNLATIKAKAIKWFAYAGLLAVMLSLSYCAGVRNTNNARDAALAAESLENEQTKTNNAIGAGNRLSVYTKTQADIDAAVKAAKAEIEEYYKANPQQGQIVEKIKLVPVPGKEELVYVPFGTCPNDLFGSDELRLFNQGNKAADFNPSNPK